MSGLVSAAATLSYDFNSRGLYSDLRYSKFTGGVLLTLGIIIIPLRIYLMIPQQ